MLVQNTIKLMICQLLCMFCFNAQAAVNIAHWETKSGTMVYFVENHDLPIIDISINFAAGSAYDTPEKSGVASVTKYLMTLGAAGLSDETIANQFADVGAVMAGSFSADRASLTLRTLSSEQEKNQSLALFNQILQKPDFPESVLNREKARIIAGLQEAATQPESIANSAFMQALYGNHPYALEENGEAATVEKMNRQDLVDFYQAHYGAKNAVLAMIGDMTREEASAIAEQMTIALPLSEKSEAIPAVTNLSQTIEKRIQHPASQSHIMIGMPSIKRDDPDLFPLHVGNYILGGGGFVSRLTEEIREKRGLAYSVYSHFVPMAERGPFMIGLQTKNEQAEEALKVVRTTVDRFLKEGVTETELKAAKANIIGGFPMRIDSNSKILGYLAMIGFYQLPLTYLEDYNQKVASVTTKQIKAAFKRNIHADNFVTIVVGDQAGQPKSKE
jgi:zinc protease